MNISRTLITLARAWQAEPHPIARHVLWTTLLNCLTVEELEQYTEIAETGAAGFAWYGRRTPRHAIDRLRALGLIRGEGRGQGGRWYAVRAMD